MKHNSNCIIHKVQQITVSIITVHKFLPICGRWNSMLWFVVLFEWSIRLIHGSIILCLLFLFTFCQLTSLSRVRNTHVFYKTTLNLVILCRRSYRLIYWWPSKSKINEVHNCPNVTLLFVSSWNFRQDFIIIIL